MHGEPVRIGEKMIGFLLLTAQFVHASFAVDSQHGILTALNGIFRFRTFDFQQTDFHAEGKAFAGDQRPFAKEILRISVAAQTAEMFVRLIDEENRIEWTSTRW